MVLPSALGSKTSRLCSTCSLADSKTCSTPDQALLRPPPHEGLGQTFWVALREVWPCPLPRQVQEAWAKHLGFPY